MSEEKHIPSPDERPGDTVGDEQPTTTICSEDESRGNATGEDAGSQATTESIGASEEAVGSQATSESVGGGESEEASSERNDEGAGDGGEQPHPASRPLPKEGPSPRGGWMIIVCVALAFILFRAMSMNASEEKAKKLTEADLRNEVQNGRVEKLERVLDSGSTYLVGRLQGENADFRVTLVPGENEKLMEFLLERGVKCTVREEKKSEIWYIITQMLILFLPLALIYWLFYKKFSGGGASPFSFGKSKAKKLVQGKDKAKITFKDVAGVDEAKEDVAEIVEFLKDPKKFTRLGARIPRGILLVGPPGTGKTLLAKAIAGEAEVPFFSISGSDFEEMFVGVGASRVRDLFEQGKKNAPCIIFIDEIDSVGQKRNAGGMTAQRCADQTLNAMLVEMDGFGTNTGVIVIAATNRPDILDPALLRPGRFDRQVHVDLPTLKGREEILKIHAAKVKLGPDADLTRLARGTSGHSGADLANIINEAALLAARRNLESIPHSVLEEARDKVFWGSERKSAGFTRKEYETTAWHESGHAILQLLLEHTDSLHKVSIIPRGQALGVTMSLPEQDVLNRTRSWFIDYMAVCCGGRIAERMHTDDISTGASQDIAMATSIARNMVCRFGMSDAFGFQAFVEPNALSVEEAPPPFSQKTAEAIDQEVKRLVDAAYERATTILEANRDKLELLATTLLEKETMDGRDVEALLGIVPKSSVPAEAEK